MDGIKFVINFDYPQNSEDYIHRIGRTGRSDTTGTSYALFTDANAKQAKDLVAVLREANQVILLTQMHWRSKLFLLFLPDKAQMIITIIFISNPL